MTDRTRSDDEDDRVLRDGERLTVRMHLMDGVQRAVTESAVRTDAVGHRPGSLPMTDAERERRASALPRPRRETQRAVEDSAADGQRDSRNGTRRATPDWTHTARYQQQVTDAWRHP